MAGYSFESLFYIALIDYLRGRYGLAYENFSEALRLAKGNMDRARANFWIYKTLIKLGETPLAKYHLAEASKFAGFYSAVAKRMLNFPVYERVSFTPVGSLSSFGMRLLGIHELGFSYYMRLEAFNRLEEFTPSDVFAVLRVDPYLAIKVAVKRFGANSDIYKSVAYPLPFREPVRKASEKFNVDRALIYAVMRQESLFDVMALSRSKAKGLMQLIDKTARWMADRLGIRLKDVYDVEVNITLGTAYLRFLLDYWRGDLVKAVASYNAGQGAVRRWSEYKDDFLFIETIPYGETRKYVKRVLWFYYIYSEKLSKDAF
jgi:soluble lytic murein transglycosylase